MRSQQELEHTIAFYTMKELNGVKHFTNMTVHGAIAIAIYKKGWAFDTDATERIYQKVINALKVKGD